MIIQNSPTNIGDLPQGSTPLPNQLSDVWIIDDFLDYNVNSRVFQGGVLTSGTLGVATTTLSDVNHPGIVRITSSTSANSGGYLRTSQSAFLLTSGYKFRAVIRQPSITTTTTRIGFIDTGSSGDNTDGVCFDIINGVATFKTSSNTIRTSSVATYTTAINTWYEFRVELGVGTARGYILNDAGVLVHTSDLLSTNVPIAVSRQTGAGVIHTNSGIVTIEGLQVDYLSVKLPDIALPNRQPW